MNENLNDIACPKCGAELEPGWVTSFKKLRWIGQDSDKAPSARKSTVLQDAPTFSLKGWMHLPALRCKACKLCIVDYETEDKDT
jgi:hypothetical protein